jgi:hypothetical protein
LPGSVLKLAQQQHGVSWVGWWGGVVGGGPTHYVVTPTRIEVELRLSWAVTTNFHEKKREMVWFELSNFEVRNVELSNV